MNEIVSTGRDIRHQSARRLPLRQLRVLALSRVAALKAENVMREARITSHPSDRLTVARNLPRIVGKLEA